jgi:serine protease
MNRLRSSARDLALCAGALLLFGCDGGGSGGGSVDLPREHTAPPDAVVHASPLRGAAPLAVVLDGRNSRPADHPIVDYIWDLGPDVEPAAGPLLTHTFTAPGSHPVYLTVTDAAGRSDRSGTVIQVDEAVGTFSISGRIRILRSSAVDADVHDTSMPPASNNSFQDAQPLPNPVALGGFINVPGAGDPRGNLFESGDPGDFYRIELSGRDTILLTVGEPEAASLAMYLWRAADPPVLVDSVLIHGDAGALRASGPGSYYIEVSANAGASNYVLHVGQDVGLEAAAARADDASNRLSADFVPGEMLVAEAPGGGTRPRLVRLEPKPTGAIGPVPLDPAIVEELVRSRAGGLRQGGRTSRHALSKLETLTAIQHFNRERERHYAEPNFIRRPLLQPDDQFFDYQWHYPGIELPAAWAITQGSADVIVAVIDTGVLLDHPDLRNQPGLPTKLTPGFNFIRDPTRARNEHGIGPDPNDPGDLAYGGSSSFHGTHVAATIAARTNNRVGVAGVSWHARIMPLRALGIGGGTSYDVIQSVRYAAGMPNDSGTVPAEPAHIINMSLGSPASSRTEQNVLREVRERGIFVVASAGNRASSEPSFPAAYPSVISVSATTIDRQLAPYSNFGPTTTLAAPGGNLQTDLNGDGIGDGVVSAMGDDSAGNLRFGYAALMGTSMAAPHVAGVIALMKAVHPGLTPDQFDSLLQSGALTDDIGPPGRDDEFGWGLVNARKAVMAARQLATGTGETVPLLSASPNVFNLGAFESEFEVMVRNVGGGTPTLTEVRPLQPWISVSAAGVDERGLGRYRVRIDRDLLPDEGTYFGTVVFRSTANDVSVSVVLQTTDIDFAADAGVHYVVLVDAADNRSVAATAVRARDGEYAYRITGVPAGRYRLFAGTDLDNDGFICDRAEACGAYRTFDRPEVITVNRSLQNLDFVSGFRSHLVSPAAEGRERIRVPPESIVRPRGGAPANAAPANGTRGDTD